MKYIKVATLFMLLVVTLIVFVSLMTDLIMILQYRYWENKFKREQWIRADTLLKAARDPWYGIWVHYKERVDANS